MYVPAATLMVIVVALGRPAARPPSAPCTVRKLAVLLWPPSTVTLAALRVGAARVVNFQVATVLRLESPLNATPVKVPVIEVVGMAT